MSTAQRTDAGLDLSALLSSLPRHLVALSMLRQGFRARLARRLSGIAGARAGATRIRTQSHPAPAPGKPTSTTITCGDLCIVEWRVNHPRSATRCVLFPRSLPHPSPPVCGSVALLRFNLLDFLPGTRHGGVGRSLRVNCCGDLAVPRVNASVAIGDCADCMKYAVQNWG